MADHPRPEDGDVDRSPRLDMSPSHESLVAVLEDIATRPVAAPSVDFIDRLEQQLLDGVTTIAPLGDRRLGRTAAPGSSRSSTRRRRTRAAVALTVIGTLAAGSAAAAVITHGQHDRTVVTPAAPDDSAAPDASITPSTVTGTTTHATGGAQASTGSASAATVSDSSGSLPSGPSGSSGPSATSVPVAHTVSNPVANAVANPSVTTVVAGRTTTTPRQDTATSSEPVPTTSPPASSLAPSPSSTATTEGHGAPVSLTIACTSTVATITCSWSASSSPGLVGYRVLRAVPGESQGRVFTPERSALSYSDATAVAGVTYGYRVQALDASGGVIEQSVLTPAALTPG